MQVQVALLQSWTERRWLFADRVADASAFPHGPTWTLALSLILKATGGSCRTHAAT